MTATSDLLLVLAIFSLAWPGAAQDAETYIVTDRAPEPNCGMAKSPRIVGGVDASPGEFPWMVSLLLNGNHYCGGALIYQHWILTAAHCVYRHSKTTLKVRVGEYKLSEKTDQEKEIAIENIIMHPNFVLARYFNDLALLRLSEDITWDESKQPICLPLASNKTYEGEEVTVAGWGWSAEPEKGGSRANVLQKLTMKVVDRKDCQDWYHLAGKYVTINPNHMCAGFKEGLRDSCHGDSGGPLMQKDGSQYRLVGIVSAGIGCARPLLPGLYTRVGEYLPWISENTKD